MSHYTMSHKYGKSTHEGEKKISLNQQDLVIIIPLTLLDKRWSLPTARLAGIYYPVSNTSSWNNNIVNFSVLHTPENAVLQM